MRRSVTRANLIGTRLQAATLVEMLKPSPGWPGGIASDSERISIAEIILGELNDYIQTWPAEVGKVSSRETSGDSLGVRDPSDDVRGLG